MYKDKPKLAQQFTAAEKNGVPFAVVLGEDELKEGKVKIKEMGLPKHHAEKNGVDVSMDDLVVQIRKRLAQKEERAEATGIEGDLQGVALEEEKTPEM